MTLNTTDKFIVAFQTLNDTAAVTRYVYWNFGNKITGSDTQNRMFSTSIDYHSIGNGRWWGNSTLNSGFPGLAMHEIRVFESNLTTTRIEDEMANRRTRWGIPAPA